MYDTVLTPRLKMGSNPVNEVNLRGLRHFDEIFGLSLVILMLRMT